MFGGEYIFFHKDIHIHSSNKKANKQKKYIVSTHSGKHAHREEKGFGNPIPHTFNIHLYFLSKNILKKAPFI